MRTLLAVLALGLLLAACKDSTGTERGPEGIYELVAVDGEPLPYALFDTEILSGDLTLYPDRTYVYNANTRHRDFFSNRVTTETETERGTYRFGGTIRGLISGGRVTLMTPEGEIQATYDGTEIVIDEVLIELRFRRLR